MARKKAPTNPHAHENPDAFRAHVERARSGAAGAHADRRTRRNRSRAAQKATAIRQAW